MCREAAKQIKNCSKAISNIIMANKEYFVLTGTLNIKYMYTQITSFHLLLDKWLLNCLEISHSKNTTILLNPSKRTVQYIEPSSWENTSIQFLIHHLKYCKI